jgi:hypothetical protein
LPEAGLSPSSMDNWKAGIRDRLLREPSRNGDPAVFGRKWTAVFGRKWDQSLNSPEAVVDKNTI